MNPRDTLRTVKRALNGDLPPVPVNGAADARWSVISSADDLYVRPNAELVDLLLEAASTARGLPLAHIQERCDPQWAAWVRRWPGQHYRLLAGLVAVMHPKVAIEIGTFHGHAALSLAAGDVTTKVVTYDIIPWRDFDETVLREADFTSGQIEQRVGDLGDPAYLSTQIDMLRSADLIFIDGPKDGAWEQRACINIIEQLVDRQRLIVFDDIRLLAMAQLWRDLPFSKLDATSLGHWAGTGLLHTRWAAGREGTD